MSKIVKIYISGPISSLHPEEAKIRFNSAKFTILHNYDAFESALGLSKDDVIEVVDPMHDLPHEHDQSYHSFMREDIKALCDCQYIALLDDWEKSDGARAELLVACTLGMGVIKLRRVSTYKYSTKIVCDARTFDNPMLKFEDVLEQVSRL